MTTRATTRPGGAVLALLAAAVLVVLVGLLWWQGGGAVTPDDPDASSSSPAADPDRDGTGDPTADPTSGLPLVAVDELPPEARDTLALIESGGPYPHEQDDGVFFNREQLLPDRPEGHYREYTVETPGSPDRGARRIVTGADGERYWTDDHYASFRRIVE